VATVAVWLRNHDILWDLFDYSIVVAAPGRIEAGLRPFASIRSPMQSSVYLFNYATEAVFGRTYLALTLGGLVQALGGGLLLRWLVRPALGSWGSTVLTSGVVLAGLIQHMIFFYNPIGILCFSLVVLGLAIEPRLGPVLSWRAGLVLAAAFIGGINKLNYHGAALVIGGLLVLGAWAGGRLTRQDVVRAALLLAMFGLVLPLGFELAWTGATLPQWFHDVVLLPGARHEHFEQVFSPAIYLQPAFALHHHLAFPAIGGLGLLVLVVAGGWLLSDAAQRRCHWLECATRITLVLAGIVLGALLMITNHETVMLTSLAYPVMAAAIYLHGRRGALGSGHWLGGTVMGATLVWSVCGGYAAWHGSRVLYGLNPPPRAEYVRLDAAPVGLAYFQGVRLHASQLEAYKITAAQLAEHAAAEGGLKNVLLGPGLELFERGYPEAITRDAPVWYDAGTTLSGEDVGYFRQLLHGGRRHLITQRGWQAWPVAIQQMLFEDYQEENVGSRDVMYVPKIRDRVPAVNDTPGRLSWNHFHASTQSNVLITATRYSPNMELKAGPRGGVFGAEQDSNWLLPMGPRDFRGQAVAWLQPGFEKDRQVSFRIMAGEGDDAELLWETPALLTAGRPSVSIPFQLQSAGKPLHLQVVVAGEKSAEVFAGWRSVLITRAGQLDSTPPLPYLSDLQRVTPAGADATGQPLWFGRLQPTPDQIGWMTVPAISWRDYDAATRKVRVTLEFSPDTGRHCDSMEIMLAWYRAGRLEILERKQLDLRAGNQLVMESSLPESVGWVGFIAKPIGTEDLGGLMRVVSWDSL